MKRFSKKAQNLNLLVPAVMTIMIVGFLLLVSLIMLDELYVETADTTGETINETLTTVTETGETLSNSTLCGFNNLAITNVSNGSFTWIESGNYTYGTRNGTIYFSDTVSTMHNNTDWNVSYTYQYSDTEACSGANSTLTGMGTIGDYIDLIVLAIIISIVLSLIIIGFGRRVS